MLPAVAEPAILAKTGCSPRFENLQINEKGEILEPELKHGVKAGRQYVKFDDDHRASWSEEVTDTARYVKKSVVRIFSADGGGVRTKFTTTLAARMEKDLGQDVKIGNVFDVFGATSAGAIPVLACLKPSAKDPTQPEYSARYINEQFPQLAEKVFPSNVTARISQYWNLVRGRCKFDKQGLIDGADLFVQNTLLKDALKEVVIPTYQPSRQMKTWYISRKLAREHPYFADITMKRTLLMTTAAPTYFEPEIYKGKRFIDGGVFANDPSEAAWINARNTYGPNSRYVVVSFGTGITPTEFDTHPKSGDGIYSMAEEFVDLLMNASEDAANQNMLEIFRLSKGYYRCQKEIKSIALDDASPATSVYMTDAANSLFDDPRFTDRWEMMIKDLSKAENTEPYAQPVA